MNDQRISLKPTDQEREVGLSPERLDDAVERALSGLRDLLVLSRYEIERAQADLTAKSKYRRSDAERTIREETIMASMVEGTLRALAARWFIEVEDAN